MMEVKAVGEDLRGAQAGGAIKHKIDIGQPALFEVIGATFAKRILRFAMTVEQRVDPVAERFGQLSGDGGGFLGGGEQTSFPAPQRDHILRVVADLFPTDVAD